MRRVDAGLQVPAARRASTSLSRGRETLELVDAVLPAFFILDESICRFRAGVRAWRWRSLALCNPWSMLRRFGVERPIHGFVQENANSLQAREALSVADSGAFI
jgi:hypothetical protein